MGTAHLQFITHYAGESILLCTMRIRLYLVPRPFRARPANTQEAALAAIRLLVSPFMPPHRYVPQTCFCCVLEVRKKQKNAPNADTNALLC